MKRLTTLVLTVAAMFAFTACADYSSTKDNHSTVDSHDITTTNYVSDTNTSGDTNTSTVDNNTTDSNNTLEVPTFAGNSQGKLVVQCEDDIVYYIGAYDCLKPDTKPTVTSDKGELTVDEELIHVGEVFYTKGHIERTEAVTVKMKVFSGGATLFQTWTETCP